MSRSLILACLFITACGTSDTTPPAPPIVDPISSPTPNATVDVSGTAEFMSEVTISGASGTAKTIADPYTARWFAKLTLAPGANQFNVTATDAAGNVSDPTVVDVTQGPLGAVAPFTLALQLAQPSAFVGIPLGFSVIAVDARGNPADQSTLSITTSDPAATVSLPNHAVTFATAGAPSQTITASLFGGTPDAVSATVTLFVSANTNQAPTVAITSPITGARFPDTFTVTVQASASTGLAQIYLQSSGAVDTFQQQLVPLDPTTLKPPVGPFSATFTVDVPGGTFGPATLVAQATDVFGNAMTSAAVTVNLDPAVGIVTGAGIVATTLSLRGQLRRPLGIAVDAAGKVYVTNNDNNFPLVVKLDPAMSPLANQTTFVTAQPNRNGQDIVFAPGAPDRFFISTTGVNRIARVDAAGTNLMLGWSADVGQAPLGLVVESSTSIAAMYNDQQVRRFSSAAAGPNTASTSSMDASANLNGSWGLEVLNVGCVAGQFQCGNGACISRALVCNIAQNCTDGSDEGGATCAAIASFKCTAGTVTSTSVNNICSGQAQCTDGSDEAGCSRYVATDGGASDEAWSFYDGGDGNPTAFDLRLDNGLNEPRGVARSPSGAFVYIASRNGNAIYQVSAAAILTRTPCIGGCPAVATGFDEAWGMAFDGTGNLLVTDRAANIVYKLSGLP